MVTPNILHMNVNIEEQPKEFCFSHYLAIISAKVVNNPEKLFVYYIFEPFGQWWDKLQLFIIATKVDRPEAWGSKQITTPQHISDYIRMMALKKHGGIYIDINTLTLRPYISLLDYDIVLAREDEHRLSNSFIIAKPNSDFLKLWLINYEAIFNPNGFGEASRRLPHRIWDMAYKTNPSVKLLGEDTLCRPLYNQVGDIFVADIDIPDNLIVLQLWEHFSARYIQAISMDWINANPHTLYSKIVNKLMDTTSISLYL